MLFILYLTSITSSANSYIKDRISLNISDSQTHNELYQIHRTSAKSKKLVFRWPRKFQDGSTDLKDGPRPGQSKAGVTNAYAAVEAGLVKQDARLTGVSS